MFSTPITADEGGYLAIARAWAHGKVLYRDVWVDRPQGLLVLFRVWDWASGGHTGSLRIMAMAFGALLVVSTALIVREAAGHRAARWTALICGVLSAAPVLEAYVANGELLSGALSAAGIAVAAIGASKPRPLRWLFASGLLAGLALSLKQSGFDGLLALLAWLALIVLAAPRLWPRVAKASLALVGGVATTITLLVVHGALTGWHRWWWAVAGYRSHTLSIFNNPNWLNLQRTAPYGLAVFGSGVLVSVGWAIARLKFAWRSPRAVMSAPGSLLPIWLITASMSFVIGGGYWRHYWLLLAGPVSALAGVAAGRARKFGAVAGLVAVSPCLAISMWVFLGAPATITVRAASDSYSGTDKAVAHWFVAHRHTGDNLYVLCDSPAAYADAHQDPGFPYLWFPEYYAGPQARQRILEYFGDSSRAPTYVAEYQSPNACEPSGQLAAIVAHSYHQEDRIGPVIILQRNSRPAGPTAR